MESKDLKDIKYDENASEKGVLNKLIGFVRKNARYFTAAALFLFLVIVVACYTGEAEDTPTNIEATTNQPEEFEVNAYPAVNELIQNYYTAYAAGDLVTLNTIATPISEREQGYISLFSQYVENYQNMVYYTKPGLDASSYMVNVYVEVKFEGVDTVAPGLDFFYVRTREDGTLYIDNLYSQYNLKNNDNPLDTSIHNLINEFERQEDVAALLQDVQGKFDAAVAADANLSTMLSTTIPDAISAWMAQLVAQNPPATEVPQEGTEVPTEIEVPTEPEVPVETPEEVPVETPEEPPVESEVPEEPVTPEEEQPEVSAIPEGTVIRLEKTTNIRKEMRADSKKVGVAYMGEKVTVVMSYAEGWTKVEWKGKTGYIRTDLLQ